MRIAALLLVLAGCTGKDKDDTGWNGSGDACYSCHEIEPIHTSLPETDCVVCHGGDGDALTKDKAHIAVPSNYDEVRGTDLPVAPHGYIKDLSPDQLDQLDPAYIRFLNPGDTRAMYDDDGRRQSCALCHNDKVETQRNSVMTTNAGHYFPTRFLAGLQDREAIYGSYAATDEECDPEEVEAACELEQLRPADAETIRKAVNKGDLDAVEDYAYGHYLAKRCNTCHASSFGSNDSPHRYRSSGCSSCHVIYGTDGVYEGLDDTIPGGLPVHPKKHEITKAIPTEQCATCHFQGGRIGLLFRGIREGGFSGQTPPDAEPWATTAYGHSAGYYLLDEDTTNNRDETPPDVHYAAGMHCADCHVGSDVHGDGRLYATSKLQVDIRCEDCHGTVRKTITPDASGIYRTSKGRALPQLSTAADGSVVLTGVMGDEFPVAQVNELLEDGKNAAMHAAMGVDGEGWSHTDSLTCDTCHTSYNQYCLGCHVTVDMTGQTLDWQTGTRSDGKVSGNRDTYSLDHILIGQGIDGRAQLVAPSQQVQLTFVDEDGNTLFDDAFRVTENSDANIGFAPFFQHTTAKGNDIQSCDACHRKNDSQAEMDRVRGVYGFGTGEFMLEHPNGDPVDALQFLDADGNQLTEWVHWNTGPLKKASRDRALNVVLP